MPRQINFKLSRVAGRKRMTMKLRAKLVYVRDHDLDQGEKGLQKIFQFQTEAGSDVRFTLLTHAGDHEGGPAATVKHRIEKDLSSPTLPREEVAKHIGGGGKLTDAPGCHKDNQYQEIVFQGDEGKEYEIEIREVPSPAAPAK